MERIPSLRQEAATWSNNQRLIVDLTASKRDYDGEAEKHTVKQDAMIGQDDCNHH
jgi:hypothetical protein